MKALTWRGIRLRIQSYIVNSGDHQLELRRCTRESGQPGTPVLMLPDFLETTDIFVPGEGEGGLAHFLASQGYDVFLPELRGKGGSWPATRRGSSWGLDALLEEDLPAHLRKLSELRAGANAFWLGHGLGSLLLMVAWLRHEDRERVLGMVHFSAARRSPTRNPALRSPLVRPLASLRGYVCPALLAGKSRCRESLPVLRDWSRWQSDSWSDSQGQDYAEALQSASLPPSLYFASLQKGQWGNIADTRRWLAELPDHDARLMGVGKQGGNLRNYSRRELLLHPQSCDDHFTQLLDWMQNLENGLAHAA
ncbi:serine aminopeptidase domain-containing protein [Gilvimarinus sp. F26214L]|uniref:serine aminopeptidase domain-containing protein n=1 Tax=Gilvimarinus sp. DZF01 TaxID=3461371 RepID=UPI0040451D29